MTVPPPVRRNKNGPPVGRPWLRRRPSVLVRRDEHADLPQIISVLAAARPGFVPVCCLGRDLNVRTCEPHDLPPLREAARGRDEHQEAGNHPARFVGAYFFEAISANSLTTSSNCRDAFRLLL